MKKIGILLLVYIVAQFSTDVSWAQTAMDAMGASSVHSTLQGNRSRTVGASRATSKARDAGRNGQPMYAEDESGAGEDQDTSSYNDEDDSSSEEYSEEEE